MNFLERLQKPNPIIVDGAMGTLLFSMLPDYRGSFEQLNIERPDAIISIHNAYIDAGAEVIETNTFGGSAIKLEAYGLDGKCIEINARAAEIANNSVRGRNIFVAGSIGPTGKLVEPMGDLSPEEIYESFAEQVRGLIKGGIDLFIIETMTDLHEAKLALLAIRDHSSLPVIASMSFEGNGRTVTGTSMTVGLSTLAECGADVVGANCSMGPDGLLNIYRKNIDSLKEIGVHLSVWANAGLPKIIDGRAVYNLVPESFAAASREFVKLGVKIIGGCCGTTPDHIAALTNAIHDSDCDYVPSGKKYKYITTRTGALDLTTHEGLLVIGERLNPSARKMFKEELLAGSQNFLREESRKQQKEGAHLLDINVGVPNLDEITAIRRSIATLTTIVDTPLMIDSDNPAVIEKALMAYPGVPIVNSINGKQKSITALLPILKRFPCFIVALCLDESGIHREAEFRIAAGEKLAYGLIAAGIDKQRIFIDPLILAESAEPGGALETLKVIEHFASQGFKTSIGLSNISFGLPQRKYVNNVFLTLAIGKGLTAAIASPGAMNVISEYTNEDRLAHDFITGGDPDATHYIAHFGGQQSQSKQRVIEKDPLPGTDSVIESIYLNVLEGNSAAAEKLVKTALTDHTTDEIMNKGLLAALDSVGRLYSTGEFFLPQMIASANAMKKGFEVLKPLLSKKSSKGLGRVVICTVRGDVHDIGKNIVSLMLENHGFEVHDLGKDVPAEKIIAYAGKVNAGIIALSSLLTTTMSEMNIVSDIIENKKLPYKLLVGGAVVNEEYAQGINAVFGKDAFDAVIKAKALAVGT